MNLPTKECLKSMDPTNAQHKGILPYLAYSVPLGNFRKTSTMTTYGLVQTINLYRQLTQNRNIKLILEANSPTQIITFH